MLKQWFDQWLGTGAVGNDAAAQETTLDLAAAALLVEVALADGHLSEPERESMFRTLTGDLGIGELQANDLLDDAIVDYEDRVGIQDLTRLLTEQWSEADRYRLVEALWRLSLAEAGIHPLEEHRIRHIADLLYLSHDRFIQAKLAAKRS